MKMYSISQNQPEHLVIPSGDGLSLLGNARFVNIKPVIRAILIAYFLN